MDNYKNLNKFNTDNNIKFDIAKFTEFELNIIDKIILNNDVKFDENFEFNNANILCYIGMMFNYKSENEDEDYKSPLIACEKYFLKAMEIAKFNTFIINQYVQLLNHLLWFGGKIAKIAYRKIIIYMLKAIKLNDIDAFNNYICFQKNIFDQIDELKNIDNEIVKNYLSNLIKKINFKKIKENYGLDSMKNYFYNDNDNNNDNNNDNDNHNDNDNDNDNYDYNNENNNEDN